MLTPPEKPPLRPWTSGNSWSAMASSSCYPLQGRHLRLCRKPWPRLGDIGRLASCSMVTVAVSIFSRLHDSPLENKVLAMFHCFSSWPLWCRWQARWSLSVIWSGLMGQLGRTSWARVAMVTTSCFHLVQPSHNHPAASGDNLQCQVPHHADIPREARRDARKKTWSWWG